MDMGVASLQIPSGTRLPVTTLSPISANTAQLGDLVLLKTQADFWVGQQLLLPKGSLFRGRVDNVQKPGYFSKGGMLRLNVEHLVMPSGELASLALLVDAASAKMDAQRNAFYTDPGIGNKISSSLNKGVERYQYYTQKGVEAGTQRGGGFNMLLTVPTNMLAGVAVGAATTTAGTAKAIFGKGETVNLQPGDPLVLDFTQRTTLQAQ